MVKIITRLMGRFAGVGWSLTRLQSCCRSFCPNANRRKRWEQESTSAFSAKTRWALYREFKSRGIQTRTRPSVGNRLWVVPVTDPDGYRTEFSSPTDTPEDTELEE